jgi:hypothetical protein
MARRQRDDHGGEKFFVREFWLYCRGLFLILALIVPDAGPSLQTHLSVWAERLTVAYG